MVRTSTPNQGTSNAAATDQRLETGRWGSVATTANLQHAATSLNLDGANYIDFRPDEFIDHGVWTSRR